MKFRSARTKGSDTVANSSFTPVTPVMSTAGMDRVRFTVWSDGDQMLVAPGLQYSDDGIVWTEEPGMPAALAVSEDPDLNWIMPGDPPDGPTTDRTISDAWVSVPSGLKTRDEETLEDNRLFVRGGVFALNKGGESGVRGGMVAMSIEVEPQLFGVVTGGPVRCLSGGGANALFTGLTPAIRMAQVGQIRVALEVEDIDAVTVAVSYQTSDDGVIWDTTVHAILDTPTSSANGIIYPTEFVPWEDTARFARVGALVTNTSSGDAEIRSAIVSMRVEFKE